MSIIFRSPTTQQVWFEWESTMSDADSKMGEIMLAFDTLLHERDEARKLAEEWREECSIQMDGEGATLRDIPDDRLDRLRLPWEVEMADKYAGENNNQCKEFKSNGNETF